MKPLKSILLKATGVFLAFTVICGVAYTAAVTGLAQLLFPAQANGSLIVADGKIYGSALLGQPFTKDSHLWGRIMNLDVSTYQDAQGNPFLYAGPSNLSPASGTYAQLVSQRVEKLRATHPAQGSAPIPVDLVTVSGSGLDPHISPAAAEYQVPRIAAARGISEEAVRNIVKACTTPRLLGLFGEETVNVLEVNLMLEGILTM